MAYTRDELEQAYRDALKLLGPMRFYKWPVLDVESKLADEDRRTDDFLASLIERDWALFETAAARAVFRDRNFRQSRSGTLAGGGSGGGSDDGDLAVTEKRLAIAMFNAREHALWPCGTVVDYQVPLKPKRAEDHGEIDLVTRTGDGLGLLELKAPRSSAALLRAALQIWTYTQLVHLARRRFFRELECAAPDAKLRPGVVTFASARSGRDLAAIGDDDRAALRSLFAAMNASLAKDQIEPVHFYRAAPDDLRLVQGDDQRPRTDPALTMEQVPA